MYQAVHPEGRAEFWTLAGLASWFGISPWTIRKYITWHLIPPALGKYPGGLNYDHTHFEAIKRLRAEIEARIPLAERRRLPHCPTREPRPTAAPEAA